MQNRQDYYGPCYAVEKIENGDFVPVGGATFLSSSLEFGVCADFDAFGSFFSKVAQTRSSLSMEGLASWLCCTKIDLPHDLFASLYAFHSVLNKDYPNASEKMETKRQSLYAADVPPLLSSIVHAKAAACSEIALLAHHCLNRTNVTNSLVVGCAVWCLHNEFPYAHSYLMVESGQRKYIYDPTNPVKTTEAEFMPSLYPIDEDQFKRWQALNQKQSAFMVVANEVSKSVAAFGVGNFTNIIPRKHLIESEALGDFGKGPAIRPFVKLING